MRVTTAFNRLLGLEGISVLEVSFVAATSVTVDVALRRRRLVCPAHGVRVEAVPFARHRSGFSRDFEDLIAFLATKTDKTTISRLSRVDWDSVGRICERVVAEGLDPGRLDGLVKSTGVSDGLCKGWVQC